MANIVVLEDERIVRNLVTLVLRQHRHSVWQASTPEHAERICNEHSVDFLVADVKLSVGRSGTESALQLIRAKPQIKCVFISGLPLENWSEKDKGNLAQMPDHSYAILCKPLSPVSLLKAIDDLLPKVETAKMKRVKVEVPGLMYDPWVKTMTELLTGIECWLRKREDSNESWNLYTATAHVCLEEMQAVAGTRRESDDDVCVYVKLVIPHVESALQALLSRDRQATLTSITDALSILAGDEWKTSSS